MNGVLGLDFNAVIGMAGLAGPVTPEVGALLAMALPEVDAAIVQALRKGNET